MSSDEKKCSSPGMENDSNQGSSVSSDLQEEYEELLRYAVVTPNIESAASQPSQSKGEVMPDVRFPTRINDILHNQGNSPVERETRMEVGKGCDCDLNIAGHSKTEGLSPVSSPKKSCHRVMDFFSSDLLGDSSSPGSHSSHAGVHGIAVSDFLVSQENLQKVENVLDLWSSGLKVISSLTHAIGKQKERIELMRTFFHWRIGHVKSRQDIYEGKIADQYFQRTLLKKVWKGWHSMVQKKWKDVVERACQARAEEVCVQISNDYETKVAVLSGALENAKAEIQRMQHEKEHFEDSMKKAFMRGVCALNLEAMTIFQNRNDTDFTNNKKEECGPGVQGKEQSAPLDPSAPPMSSAVAQAPSSAAAAAMGAASTAAFPSAFSIASAGATSASSVHLPVSAPLGAGSTAPAALEEMYVPRVMTSAQQKAGRTITARITGRCDFASKQRVSSSLAIMGVSPPMSSVVVEKHHPVTVQTIPQAAAAKYPRTIHPESTTSASRPLGTRSAHTQSLASVHSIKVVD
ncbi:centrosomal protein POC5 isoform X2 [Saccopteryx bilineata]|uniref:centrosomal protein POC5 isoform X2 n=1 Tax=Saccopteryx bilineata TaxID=59482 RepID=UPI00338EB75F